MNLPEQSCEGLREASDDMELTYIILYNLIYIYIVHSDLWQWLIQTRLIHIFQTQSYYALLMELCHLDGNYDCATLWFFELKPICRDRATAVRPGVCPYTESMYREFSAEMYRLFSVVVLYTFSFLALHSFHHFPFFLNSNSSLPTTTFHAKVTRA